PAERERAAVRQRQDGRVPAGHVHVGQAGPRGGGPGVDRGRLDPDVVAVVGARGPQAAPRAGGPGRRGQARPAGGAGRGGGPGPGSETGAVLAPTSSPLWPPATSRRPSGRAAWPAQNSGTSRSGTAVKAPVAGFQRVAEGVAPYSQTCQNRTSPVRSSVML